MALLSVEEDFELHRTQRFGAESIPRMSPLEEGERGKHVGGLESPICEEEGNDDANGLHNCHPSRAIGLPMVIRDQGGLKLQGSFATEGVEVGRGSDNPSRQRKMKGLSELMEPSTHPRRSVRLSEKLAQVRRKMLSGEDLPSISISDGDISNCNAHMRALMELGRNLQIFGSLVNKSGLLVAGRKRKWSKKSNTWKSVIWNTWKSVIWNS